MDKEAKSGIIKLRELRDHLCSKQSEWRKAFKVKDSIVEELRVLKKLAVDPEISNEVIVSKIDCLLILIDPERQEDLEKSNV